MQISTPQSGAGLSLSQHSTSFSSTPSYKSTTGASESGEETLGKTNNFRTMIVNVDGFRAKSAVMDPVVDFVYPDVIIACESKLTDEVAALEFLPDSYRRNILRKDWNAHGGSVYITTQDEFITTPLDNSHSESESVWVEVSVPDGRNVKLCSFYHPPKPGEAPVKALSKSMSDMFL